jgi:hypothetical protein
MACMIASAFYRGGGGWRVAISYRMLGAQWFDNNGAVLERVQRGSVVELWGVKSWYGMRRRVM